LIFYPGQHTYLLPIDWHNSKTPGFVLHADLPNYHHFSAFVSMSSVSARFFPLKALEPGLQWAERLSFRIDHDEKFNETRTFSTRFPENAVRGSDLTGGLTAA